MYWLEICKRTVGIVMKIAFINITPKNFSYFITSAETKKFWQGIFEKHASSFSPVNFAKTNLFFSEVCLKNYSEAHFR